MAWKRTPEQKRSDLNDAQYGEAPLTSSKGKTKANQKLLTQSLRTGDYNKQPRLRRAYKKGLLGS